MRNHEHEFLLRGYFHANEIHIHMNDFAQRLVLKQRHKVTWKLKNTIVVVRHDKNEKIKSFCCH